MKNRIIKAIVYNRLRVQRGLSIVAMFYSTITVVGVYRDSFPTIPWWTMLLIGATVYLACSWCLGMIDEIWLWKVESEKYGDMNPYATETLERVKRIEEKLNETHD